MVNAACSRRASDALARAARAMRSLVISIRVYILGPRTNPSNWRANMAKAKKKAKKKAAKKK